MLHTILEWISGNWPELTGSILGLIAVFFQYKQNPLSWPVSIIVALLYAYVFINSGLYAYTLLQVYYFVISIYGWHMWVKKSDKNEKLKVTRTTYPASLILLIVFIILASGLYFLLHYFTDSDVEYADSFITSLSFVATWMLANKKLENWLIWLVADVLSVGLYIHKELFATAVFYSVLSVVAIAGFFEWKKQMQKS